MKLHLSRSTPHFVVREDFITLCVETYKFSHSRSTWLHFKFSNSISSEIHLITSYLYPYFLSDFGLKCWYISHFHYVEHMFWPPKISCFEHQSTTCRPVYIYIWNLFIIKKFESICHYISYFQISFIVYIYFIHWVLKRYFVFHRKNKFQIFKTEINYFMFHHFYVCAKQTEENFFLCKTRDNIYRIHSSLK